MTQVKNILVVGGGIGGQSVAIALKKAGFEPEIVEIHQEFNVYGVGIIQQANALRALDAIGVADEAIRRGSPYGKVKLCIPTGQQIGEAGTPQLDIFLVIMVFQERFYMIFCLMKLNRQV
jgi:2-polyprenyl-6-methoxyphenol hydroxylase-like FAD-dependent oxidoreductase